LENVLEEQLAKILIAFHPITVFLQRTLDRCERDQRLLLHSTLGSQSSVYFRSSWAVRHEADYAAELLLCHYWQDSPGYERGWVGPSFAMMIMSRP
jgi:hypothetical protein